MLKLKKIRKKNILHIGYYFVSGSLGSRKNKITFRIHKAVAETFIPTSVIVETSLYFAHVTNLI